MASRSSCAVAFLRRAVAWFAERGVHVCEVMSDNGSCYVAHEYAHALSELQLRHLRIKPGRPRTNGKAERFIQTLLNEWAYGRIYGSSEERRKRYRSSSSATTSDDHTAPSANRCRPQG